MNARTGTRYVASSLNALLSFKRHISKRISFHSFWKGTTFADDR